MLKQVFSGFILIVTISWPFFCLGQHSKFELDKSLDQHVSESLIEGMNGLSNQIELIYAIPDTLSGNISISKFGECSYFYPASIVKLPVLLLALEWVNSLNNPLITENTPFVFKSNYLCVPNNKKTEFSVDEPTVANYIKKILLVSDNNSYNNLFHLLGRTYINKNLRAKDFEFTQITKSFVGCDFDAHNNLPGVSFIVNNLDTLKIRNDTTIQYFYDSVALNQLKLNKYYKKGILMTDTLDFVNNNYLPLAEGLEMLMRVIKPELFPPSKRWKITEKQRQLILKYMSIYPRESKLNKYANYEKYPDSFKKYFMFGFLTTEKINEPIRIYNIVGLAYGFTIDIAYIENQNSNDGFFLASSMSTNENGKSNKGYTNYRKQAFPFFTKLGWSIYKDVYGE